jgi:hypothetical protein
MIRRACGDRAMRDTFLSRSGKVISNRMQARRGPVTVRALGSIAGTTGKTPEHLFRRDFSCCGWTTGIPTI